MSEYKYRHSAPNVAKLHCNKTLLKYKNNVKEFSIRDPINTIWEVKKQG